MAETIRKRVIIELITQAKGFVKGMNMPLQAMKKVHTNAGIMNESFKKNITMGQRMALNMRNLTHGLRGFRMEMLGIMFFGMAMQRMFFGLLKPTAELFGIFDMWRTTLQVFFLPVIEMLFPWFLKLTEWLMGLSPETQKFIGILVVLGGIFGTIIMVIGTLALGIGSLILAFGAGVIAIKVLAGATAIGLLIIAIAYLITHWDDVKKAAQWAWDGMKKAAEISINFMISEINKLIDIINLILPESMEIKRIGNVDFTTPDDELLGASYENPWEAAYKGGQYGTITINNDVTINDVPPGNEARAGEDVVIELKRYSPIGGS